MVKIHKSTNNQLSFFGLIEENMDLSCIHLAVLGYFIISPLYELKFVPFSTKHIKGNPRFSREIYQDFVKTLPAKTSRQMKSNFVAFLENLNFSKQTEER